MGFKSVDLNPPGSIGPTALTPPGKAIQELIFQLSRTDTAAGILKAVLPADASIMAITLYASTNSNAGTTATGTVTVSNNSGTLSTGSVNLLTAGATTAAIQMNNLPNIEPFPLLGDIKITAQYAETGGASSAGGPWVIGIRYVR